MGSGSTFVETGHCDVTKIPSDLQSILTEHLQKWSAVN